MDIQGMEPRRAQRDSGKSAGIWSKIAKRWQAARPKQKAFMILVIAIALAVLCAAVAVKVLPRHNVIEDAVKKNPMVKEYQEKLPKLKSLADKKKKDPTAQRDYAVALYIARDLDAARKQYEKALDVAPKDASLYNELGNIYRDLKNYNKAADNYRSAIKYNPQLLNAYTNLANMQIYLQKKTDEGISTYKMALEAMPGNDQVLLLMGMAYEQKGEKTEAKNSYKEILKKDAENAAAKAGLQRLDSE